MQRIQASVEAELALVFGRALRNPLQVRRDDCFVSYFALVLCLVDDPSLSMTIFGILMFSRGWGTSSRRLFQRLYLATLQGQETGNISANIGYSVDGEGSNG